MADLAHEDGVEPESRGNSPEPSPSAVAPRNRIGCDHVTDGAPVAGFTTIRVNGRMADGTIVALRAGSILLDLCADCLALVREGESAHYNHDRRHETRPPSSVAEQPVDNRQVAAETTDSYTRTARHGESAAEALGSTPAVGSNLIPSVFPRDFGDHKHDIESWDEHRLSDRERWAYGSGPGTLAGDDDL